MSRTAGLFAGLGIVLALVNAAILGKERLIADGTPVYLRLTPRDPRSLMQGDYMVLRFTIAERIARATKEDGFAVVRRDGEGVASFVRIHADGDALGTDEYLLRFRLRNGRVRIGAESFFFQEGHAERYQDARYGELRVGDAGDCVLVGLLDAELKPLGGD